MLLVNYRNGVGFDLEGISGASRTTVTSSLKRVLTGFGN